MKKFFVGIDGSDTPDPAYWRARNEFITAESEQEAKDIWGYMRSDWLRADEEQYIQAIEVKSDIGLPASSYEFTKNGQFRVVYERETRG